MDKKITAFVSYSWDSEEHQKWVRQLVKDLNSVGIEATMDTLETEHHTVHLGEMMASSVDKNDYTLVVMTPHYAYKANQGQGGVGTETRYIMNLMDDNKNRVIPLIRRGEDSSAIPFYLKQINYIDFRNNLKYEESFESLLKRMRYETINKPSISEFSTVTKNNVINPSARVTIKENRSRKVPNLRKITELDKNRFIREAFDYLKSELKEVLEQTKEENAPFDFIFEEEGSTKLILQLYVEGNSKVNYKIWVDSFMSNTDSIYVSHGRINTGRDNSFNDVIQVDENDGILKLQRTMNFLGNRTSLTKDELVDSLWEEIVGQIKL